MRRFPLAAIAAWLAVLWFALGAPRTAYADEPDVFSDEVILDAQPAARATASTFSLKSFRARMAYLAQHGNGYQSQAGPLTGPGSERVIIVEPQIEAVITQGERMVHRVWVPLDVVSAASPDAIDQHRVDVMSQASRITNAGTFDWTGTYKLDRQTEVSTRGAFHLESNYRSWTGGIGFARSLADDNATLSASVNEVADWFDIYSIDGHRQGHSSRSALNVNVGLTQLLSPTTVAYMGYGGTVQTGTLGNTWNSVPFGSSTRVSEIIPDERVRNAFVGRIAQYLPWHAAVKGYARLYFDDWGALAGTGEVTLDQRIVGSLVVSGTYRLHEQRGVAFFTTNALDSPRLYRTADSDLQTFAAQTVGTRLSFDVPGPHAPDVHVDFGYDHYFRTNSLTIDTYLCGAGLVF